MKNSRHLIFWTILVSLLVFSSINSQAQAIPDSSNHKVSVELITDSDFEALFDKYSSKTAEFISNTVENLSDEALFVWDIMIMKKKLDWFIALGIFIFSIIMAVSGHFIFGGLDEYKLTFGGFCVGFGIFAALISGIVCISMISYLVVPEYHVIKDLIEIIK